MVLNLGEVRDACDKRLHHIEADKGNSSVLWFPNHPHKCQDISSDLGLSTRIQESGGAQCVQHRTIEQCLDVATL